MAATKKATSKQATSGRRTASKAPARRTTGATKKKSTAAAKTPDAIAVIKADHKAVNELFRTYQGLGERALTRKRQVADKIIKELSVHAAIEEEVLYPRARQALQNGKSLVREAKQEHLQLKRALVRLEKLSPDDRRFAATMKEIRADVRHHVREEEASAGILGRMRAELGRDELQLMAKVLRVAKRTAPTRPHPGAPTSAPANVVVGTAAGVVDRARDAIERRS